MKMPQLSPKQKAGIAVLFALIMWAPSGLSSENVPVVTGHSVFFNGDTFDKCLASIAGIMRSRVMWFNDMVLVEQYAGKGTFIYITEDGAPNPAEEEQLYTQGVFYDFVDPNGAHWHVEEAFMIHGNAVSVGQPDINGGPWDEDFTISPGGAQLSQNRTYVWIVELSERPIHDEFAGDPTGPYYHDLYNFLLIVDTCKMDRDRTTPTNLTHEGADLDTERGHPTGSKAHIHEVHDVNLWVGRQPVIVPWGPPSAQSAYWQADWATGYAANDTTRPSTGGATSNEYPCRTDDPLTEENEAGC